MSDDINYNDEASIANINKLFEDEVQKEFLSLFNDEFNNTLEKLYFTQIQMNIGHRLRPRMVYWGYMFTHDPNSVTTSELNTIAKIATSIEYIHKASIILDDLIDNDCARHGKPTFHTIYGSENTILFSLNMLSVSLMNLNNIFSHQKINPLSYNKSMSALIDTMFKMSLGCLQEQNLNEETFCDLELIRDIIKKETASLLTNSLLLGYYAGDGNNIDIEEQLINIGDDCGYCFQAMNDLEPFSNKEKLISHKGTLNTDIKNNKKNIAIAILMNMVTSIEKHKILKKDKDLEEYVYFLYEKYKIKEIIKEEVGAIQERVQKNIGELCKYSQNGNWGNDFLAFINSLYMICKKRL